MKKLICGSVILFQEVCPLCKETNLSANHTFECNCGNRYKEQSIKSTKYIAVKNKRSNVQRFGKILRDMQNNHCYWCDREFDSAYLKQNKRGEYVTKTLKLHIDHKIPYAYTKNDNPDNLCASCIICNHFKHDHCFDNEDDCVDFLKHKWNKVLRNETVIFV